MAGISQMVTPEEVLPLLSRNVFIEGFQGTSQPTEFLVLLRRYVVQARELTELAAHSGMVIRVAGCDDAQSLLHILGYRTRPDCGKADTALLTDDPERAFLTIDSGFPCLTWSGRCREGSLSNTSFLLLPCQCSSLEANGPWQARRITPKTAGTCWTRF